MMVRATIDGTTQAELTAAEELCKLALRQEFKDLVLYQDSGQQSGTRLISARSLSGVQIIDGPTFSEVDGPEYVNQRTVEFTAECQVVIPGTEKIIVSWEETISVSGDGGPQYVWRFPINDVGFPQVVSPSSLVTTTQSGRAVGHLEYPSRPVPTFGKNPPGAIYRGDKSSVRELSPTSLGRGWIDYPIEWVFVYESTKVLAGKHPIKPPLA